MRIQDIHVGSSYNGKKEPERIRTVVKEKHCGFYYNDSKYPCSSPFFDYYLTFARWAKEEVKK